MYPRDAFIRAAQIMRPTLLYLPERGAAGITIPDLSGAGLHAAPKNGPTIGSGMVDGAAASVLDGTNDFLDTGFATRTNWLKDPNCSNVAIWGKGGFFSNELESISLTEIEKWDGTTSIKCVASAASVAQGLVAPASAVIPTGSRVTASAYVKAPAGTKLRIYVARGDAEQSEFSEEVTATGGWQRLTVTGPVATAEKSWSLVVRREAKEAVTFYVDAAMLEVATSAGTYFPTAAQLASGEAGWSGTVNESASDIGPFARGTARTYVLMANRANSNTFDSLYGSNIHARLDEKTQDFTYHNGTAHTFAGVWPGNEVAVLSALVVDEVGATVALSINGGALSSKALTASSVSRAGNLLVGDRTASLPLGGSVLPFAVFPRALSQAEISTLALSTQIIQPAAPAYVPPELRLVSFDSGNAAYELTDLVDNLRYSNVDEGGDESCSFTFPNDWGKDADPVKKGNKLQVLDGMEVLWQGRIMDVERSAETIEAFDVVAYGSGISLQETTMQEIYVDKDVTKWGEGSSGRKIANLSATFGGRPYRYSQEFSASADNATYGPGLMMVLSSVQAGTTPFGEFVYYGGGVDLGAVRFDYRALGGFGKDANMNDAVAIATDDVGTGAESSKSYEQSTALNQELAAGKAGQKYAFAQGTYVAALAEGTYGNARGFFNLMVIGRHGLTVQGSWPNIGFWVSQIIVDAADRAPEIQIRRVDATTFVLQQAAYIERSPIEDIVRDANRYEAHQRTWGTWATDNTLDSSLNGYFDYVQRDSDAEWVIWKDDADNVRLDSHMSDLFNSVDVAYTTGDGIQRVVTRTANIPDLQGIPRSARLDAGVMPTIVAETLGDTFLALFGGFAPAAGDIEVTGTVKHEILGTRGAHFMRADGSTVRVPDILPASDLFALSSLPDRKATFPIKKVEVDASDLRHPRTTISVDQGTEAMSALQAQVEVENNRIA